MDVGRACRKTAQVGGLEPVEIGELAGANSAAGIGSLDRRAVAGALEGVDRHVSARELGARCTDVEHRATDVLAVVRRVVTASAAATGWRIRAVRLFLRSSALGF